MSDRTNDEDDDGPWMLFWVGCQVPFVLAAAFLIIGKLVFG